MPLSYAVTESLTCPQCKTPFDAEIWLTVDAGERPDLAARCHEGVIHAVTCPNGHSGLLGAPLLYHDRAKKQLFLAYPPGMPEKQLKDTGNRLIQQLRGQLLILPGSNYLDAPRAIPVELLPAAMDDKLDEVIAELGAQAAQLEELRKDPAVSAALRALQEQPALVETIQQWVDLDAWNLSGQFLQAHPELVSETAELVLTAMLELARAQGDPDAQEDLTLHRDLVRAARQNGIDAAYAEYLEPRAGAAPAPAPRLQLQARLDELNIHSQDELERALPDHPDLQDLIRNVMLQENPILQAVDGLMDTRSPQDVLTLARDYPALLDDQALRAIREIISNARTGGDSATADHLQLRLDTLEQVKSGSLRPDELARQAAIQASIDPATEAEIRALIEQENIQSNQAFQAALEKRPDLRAKLEAAAERAVRLPPQDPAS